jgi:hypothetical protein
MIRAENGMTLQTWVVGGESRGLGIGDQSQDMSMAEVAAGAEGPFFDVRSIMW